MRKRRNKRKDIKCSVCGKTATHVVLVELREKPGLPLKEDNVLVTVCDEHALIKDFEYWVPPVFFKQICEFWAKEGYVISKAFCNINILKLK